MRLQSKLLKTLGALLAVAVLVTFFQTSAPGAFAQGGDIFADTGPESSGVKDKAPVHVKVRMIADRDALVPGGKIRLGIVYELEPHWHIYYKEPGDAGMPTSIEWNFPPGFQAGELIWEKPTKFSDAGIVTYGYQDRMVLAADVAVPDSLKPGEKVEIKALSKWLSCKDICIPGQGEASLTLPVSASAGDSPDKKDLDRPGFTGSVDDLGKSAGTGSTSETAVSSEPDSEKSIAYYFLFALVGGFILNFMPCVLPVIAIKVMSLIEQADEEPARVKLLGAVFSAGIVSAFLVLASLVLLVRAAGESVGWGFQFQYPGFIIAMCVIVLLLSLSLFGLFYFSFSTGQDKLDQLSQKEGLTGSFFKGVLATTLSTPCTAPFLGTALGFAFSQPAWVVLGIFFASGLGMSLPYLVLTAFPALMKRIPKPGAWMEKFKESMGFILLGTVIWLLGVLGSQVGESGVMWTSFFLLTVSLSAWMVGRFIDLSSSRAQKVKIWTLALLVSLAGFYLCIWQQPVLVSSLDAAEAKSGDGIDWQPFSKAALESALADGKTVFLDFTADWCLTCKAYEKTAISTKPVIEKMKELKVLPMQADWTRRDPEITEALAKFKRSGVPLYVVYPAADPRKPLTLPDFVTTEIVLDYLEKAGPSKN
ncbi:MAG: thioredoxin family protein [Cyanobacteria bacterium HKST-UBA02]|nr:thioredoxin family protein [Cyanobacteria bacterium HKST-UBA02]